MSLIERLFGKKPSVPPTSRMHSQISSGGLSQQNAMTMQGTTRRELLRVVLRDTLNRHGIPSAWIAAEVLTTTSRNGERGVHWRLMIKHWDPRLLACEIALQQALIKRVTTFDPLASNWLTGISWQFALEDESQCPPLPHPGSWTSAPHELVKVAPAPEKVGGVIEGPVRIAPQAAPGKEVDAARADLDQLLAIRDADFKQHGGTKQTWASTEPAKLDAR
ncbi:hypothetical protein [Ramlibacter sp. PS4R-6]|uniref:hypothetical protein n=1 Tax=Ramlibacter sp. PS4R-6 TaxID=3133438 RepID=UPI0030B2F9C6